MLGSWSFENNTKGGDCWPYACIGVVIVIK